jgi:hypothetical protein
MSPTTPDTQRTFGSRFAMTGDAIATPLYDEHQARDLETGVEVGLWVPRPQLFSAPGARDRLAAAAGEIRGVIHPRVRRVFAAGDSPATWISLQPAHALEVDVAVPRHQLIDWVDGIAGALLALHWAGLVHGGVLESDVVVVDGELRLGGGGIWACADSAVLARIGHAAALAPERRDGRPATPATDAWSLGALVARWVAGPGPDPLLATERRHPALAAELGPLMADDPARRRHDLIELVTAVRAALATPYTDEAPVKPRGRRRKKNTTEERTTVGHASGAAGTGAPAPDEDDEPTVRAASPVALVAQNNPERAVPILAVSMMQHGGPGARRLEQPTPPAPTPQLQRPILRPPTSSDAGQSLGRLAPPRAAVEAQRKRARRPWIFAALAVLVAAVIVLVVLGSR